MSRRIQPRTVGVKVNLGLLEVSGEWAPNDVERRAAWELYVELITRVSTVPLKDGEGLLREALSSLVSLFQTTRDILRRHGPDLAEPKPSGQFNFAYLAVTILNSGLRPFLTRWHPALTDWEAHRPDGKPAGEHERAWPQAAACRADLETTREALTDYAAALSIACGVPNLLEDGELP